MFKDICVLFSVVICVQNSHSMLRTLKCEDFQQIGKLSLSLGIGTAITFDFDGVLMKNKWNSPPVELTRECLKDSIKLAEKYQKLNEILGKLADTCPSQDDRTALDKIAQNQAGVQRALGQSSRELQELYHRVNNFTTNQAVLADSSIPEVLHTLRENSIPFFCLTSNYDACSLIRLDQFRRLNLSSYFETPFLLSGTSPVSPYYFLRPECNTVFTSITTQGAVPEDAPEDAPCRFHGRNQISPLIFSKNPGKYYAYFSKNSTTFSKGTVLERLIADGVVPRKPKHIVFVDDIEENVREVGKICLKLGIDFYGVHFTAKAE
jgi:FMN phosphatase YigB (HAD superfamily)